MDDVTNEQISGTSLRELFNQNGFMVADPEQFERSRRTLSPEEMVNNLNGLKHQIEETSSITYSDISEDYKNRLESVYRIVTGNEDYYHGSNRFGAFDSVMDDLKSLTGIGLEEKWLEARNVWQVAKKQYDASEAEYRTLREKKPLTPEESDRYLDLIESVPVLKSTMDSARAEAVKAREENERFLEERNNNFDLNAFKTDYLSMSRRLLDEARNLNLDEENQKTLLDAVGALNESVAKLGTDKIVLNGQLSDMLNSYGLMDNGRTSDLTETVELNNEDKLEETVELEPALEPEPTVLEQVFENAILESSNDLEKEEEITVPNLIDILTSLNPNTIITRLNGKAPDGTEILEVVGELTNLPEGYYIENNAIINKNNNFKVSIINMKKPMTMTDVIVELIMLNPEASIRLKNDKDGAEYIEIEEGIELPKGYIIDGDKLINTNNGFVVPIKLNRENEYKQLETINRIIEKLKDLNDANFEIKTNNGEFYIEVDKELETIPAGYEYYNNKIYDEKTGLVIPISVSLKETLENNQTVEEVVEAPVEEVATEEAITAVPTAENAEMENIIANLMGGRIPERSSVKEIRRAKLDSYAKVTIFFGAIGGVATTLVATAAFLPASTVAATTLAIVTAFNAAQALFHKVNEDKYDQLPNPPANEKEFYEMTFVEQIGPWFKQAKDKIKEKIEKHQNTVKEKTTEESKVKDLISNIFKKDSKEETPVEAEVLETKTEEPEILPVEDVLETTDEVLESPELIEAEPTENLSDVEEINSLYDFAKQKIDEKTAQKLTDAVIAASQSDEPDDNLSFEEALSYVSEEESPVVSTAKYAPETTTGRNRWKEEEAPYESVIEEPIYEGTMTEYTPDVKPKIVNRMVEQPEESFAMPVEKIVFPKDPEEFYFAGNQEPPKEEDLNFDLSERPWVLENGPVEENVVPEESKSETEGSLEIEEFYRNYEQEQEEMLRNLGMTSELTRENGGR